MAVTPQQAQNLVTSETIVAIIEQPALAARLAWRGGAVLHKLWLRPASRYSEDMDLVQVRAEPISAAGNTCQDRVPVQNRRAKARS